MELEGLDREINHVNALARLGDGGVVTDAVAARDAIRCARVPGDRDDVRKLGEAGAWWEGSRKSRSENLYCVRWAREPAGATSLMRGQEAPRAGESERKRNVERTLVG